MSEHQECQDCIQDDEMPCPGGEGRVPMTRRDVLRTYGIKGLVLSLAAAAGIAVTRQEAGAAWVFGGYVITSWSCYSHCRRRVTRCEYWYNNTSGASEYRNCYVRIENYNCCSYYGAPSNCCS